MQGGVNRQEWELTKRVGAGLVALLHACRLRYTHAYACATLKEPRPLFNDLSNSDGVVPHLAFKSSQCLLGRRHYLCSSGGWASEDREKYLLGCLALLENLKIRAGMG